MSSLTYWDIKSNNVGQKSYKQLPGGTLAPVQSPGVYLLGFGIRFRYSALTVFPDLKGFQDI